MKKYFFILLFAVIFILPSTIASAAVTDDDVINTAKTMTKYNGWSNIVVFKHSLIDGGTSYDIMICNSDMYTWSDSSTVAPFREQYASYEGYNAGTQNTIATTGTFLSTATSVPTAWICPTGNAWVSSTAYMSTKYSDVIYHTGNIYYTKYNYDTSKFEIVDVYPNTQSAPVDITFLKYAKDLNLEMIDTISVEWYNNMYKLGYIAIIKSVKEDQIIVIASAEPMKCNKVNRFIFSDKTFSFSIIFKFITYFSCHFIIIR
jgi:hypothetical protein